MATTVKTTFKLKRGTAQRWRELNPILAAGEPGFELDQGRLKVGNGVTPWNDLPYIGSTNLTEADIERILALLKEEIASQELIPIDGTIILGQPTENTRTIKVGIASEAGNALRVVEDGLFVSNLIDGEGIDIIEGPDGEKIISLKEEVINDKHIAYISSDKIVQSEGTKIILNGGNANG